MKGTFFQKPLELQLYVDGETWRQGDTIRGRFVIKNMGTSDFLPNSVQLLLSHGELKGVRAKESDAFEIISSAHLDWTGMVAPQCETEARWEIKTERNCPITDSSASLFLVYGAGESYHQMGQLQLNMCSDAVIQEFLNTLTTQFRFVRKSEKAAKDCVEAKLLPPSSKSFVTLDQLIAQFRYEGESLKVKYQFQIKKIDPTAAAFAIKKGKKEILDQLGRSDYLLPSGRINPDCIEASIKKALATIEAKVIF